MNDEPLVKRARKAAGLTQKQFSEQYGIPIGTIRDWEQRRKKPEAAATALLHAILADPSFVAAAQRNELNAPNEKVKQVFANSSDIPVRSERDTGDENQTPPVQEDEFGNICLNDLWRMGGSLNDRRPGEWRRTVRAKTLDTALRNKIMGESHNLIEKDEISTIYTTGRGRSSRTFAHPVLALDFAEFVNPGLGVAVRETFLRYKTKDVTLAAEILDGLSERAEFDAARVEMRDLLKEHNKLSAGAAKEAGVRNFEAYNGAGLRGLYGGLTKTELLKRKGLPDDVNRLDFAGHEELAANYFKATQAIAKLRREGIRGQDEAEQAHEQVGQAVRQTIESIGGTMPEDEPAVENISEARKRLKIAEKAQIPRQGT